MVFAARLLLEAEPMSDDAPPAPEEEAVQEEQLVSEIEQVMCFLCCRPL